MRKVLLAATVFLATTLAAAAGDGRRMLSGEEARVWTGVGRLNIAGNRFCTATLISDRLILTAAHCLYNPRTKARVAAGQIRFVAGLRLGQHEGVRRVIAAATLPGYRYDGAASAARAQTDVALLTLDAPILAVSFQTATLSPAEHEVTIVSYARDRPHAPSIQQGCKIARSEGVLSALSCDVTFGASGSPVFSLAGGEPRIVAVVSAMGRSDGDTVAVAVAVAQALPALRAQLARDAAEAASAARVALVR